MLSGDATGKMIRQHLHILGNAVFNTMIVLKTLFERSIIFKKHHIKSHDLAYF